MNDDKQLIQLVSVLSPLGAVSEDGISRIKRIFSRAHFHRNQCFLEAGSLQTRIGFVNSGIFRYFYIDFEGKERTKHFVTANDFIFSLSAFIEKKPSRYFIEAAGDSEVLLASEAAIEELLAQSPEWQKMYTALLEKYYVMKEKREAELLLHDARTRYIHFLKSYPHIAAAVKSRHIASYLGMSAETLSRIRGRISTS